MDQSAGNATIFDVAKLCGVSRGTVDRVLHRRGRVSQATIDKVERAIEILGYRPNPNASLLASRKTFVFSCLIPTFRKGEYWEKIYEGFQKGAVANPYFNIELDFHLYNQTDLNSYKKCCRDILEANPAGVIMNTVFRTETAKFSEKLDAAQIPYAFVDNVFDELNYTVYYGVDPYKSGALGAFLLTNRSNPKEILQVRLIRDLEHHADPNSTRRQGFMDYIHRTLPETKVHTVFVQPSDPQQTYLTLDRFFKENPNVKHLVMTSSRIYLIDEFLQNNPDPERVVLGFDSLEGNVASLRSGNVEYLVTRHIAMQSYHALVALAEFVIRKVTPQKRKNYLHMDILHRLNLDDYES